jgi:hypothetical protein
MLAQENGSLLVPCWASSSCKLMSRSVLLFVCALTIACSILHFILFVFACRACHVMNQRKKTRQRERKLDLDRIHDLQLATKQATPEPVIITCVHCKRDVADRSHEDDEFVPKDWPPHYSVFTRELSAADHVDADSRKAELA